MYFLTASPFAVYFYSIGSELLINETRATKTGVAHIKIWRVTPPIAGLDHSYKYSLALVIDGECALRYDVHPGKADHKHIGDRELPYTFTSLEQLLADFWTDVENIE